MKTATVILHDHMRVIDAAALSLRTGQPLVIDRDGQVKLVPQVLPGMQRIAVLDKQAVAA